MQIVDNYLPNEDGINNFNDFFQYEVTWSTERKNDNDIEYIRNNMDNNADTLSVNTKQ